jgi:DNA-binding LacI/PurR family transcriptional regulator
MWQINGQLGAFPTVRYDAGVGTVDGGSAASSRRRPTIDDVARLAGVGRGTVSRVINGGRNVRPAVRDAVNEAIDALGYSVNQSARNLARGRTGSVAFVISEHEERLFEDPNFGLFARTFSRQLRHSGRHLLIATAGDEAEENSLGDYLTLGHVDGALLALTHDEEPLLLRLQANKLPFVVLGKPLGFEKAFSWVAIDDEKAAFTIVSYLVGKVSGTIGTVSGPLQTSSGLERLAGCRRALGDRFRPDLVVTGDWSLQSGRQGTEELLRRHPGLRGLFVASDLMAVGAIGALRAAGRRVPEDVAVVGFDDSAAATMVEPALTTIRNPIEQTALEALRILDDQIAGHVHPPVQLVLGSELVARSSA